MPSHSMYVYLRATKLGVVISDTVLVVPSVRNGPQCPCRCANQQSSVFNYVWLEGVEACHRHGDCCVELFMLHLLGASKVWRSLWSVAGNG